MNKKEIQKGRHSRMFLPGISLLYVVSQIGKILHLVNNKKAGDPRLQHSGMTAFFGFTLIELLVVVLITGILAAIALPQYEKAVEKSRLAEAYAITASLKQDMDSYILTNGTATISTEDFPFNIDLSHLPLVSDGTDDKFYASKYFLYEVYCNTAGTACYTNAFRYKKADYSDLREHYALNATRTSNTQWRNRCIYKSSFGQSLCKTLPDVTLVSW